MTTSALMMMVLVQVIVSLVTIYFFLRVLRTPKKPEPDSYIENDEEGKGES